MKTFNRSEINTIFEVFSPILKGGWAGSWGYPKIIDDIFSTNHLKSIDASMMSMMNSDDKSNDKATIIDHIENILPTIQLQKILCIDNNLIEEVNESDAFNFFIQLHINGHDIANTLRQCIHAKKDREGINFIIDGLMHITNKFPETKLGSDIAILEHSYNLYHGKANLRHKLKQVSHMFQYSEYENAQKFFKRETEDVVQDFIKAKTVKNAYINNSKKLPSYHIEDYFSLKFNLPYEELFDDLETNNRMHEFIVVRLVQKIAQHYEKDVQIKIQANHQITRLGTTIVFEASQVEIKNDIKNSLIQFHENFHEMDIPAEKNFIEFSRYFDKAYTYQYLQNKINVKEKTSTLKI